VYEHGPALSVTLRERVDCFATAGHSKPLFKNLNDGSVAKLGGLEVILI
jgi:hypothetical protein